MRIITETIIAPREPGPKDYHHPGEGGGGGGSPGNHPGGGIGTEKPWAGALREAEIEI